MYEVLKGKDFTDLLKGNVSFVLCIGNTKTAEIPGITVAGANPDLIKFTPPADAELLYYGKCKSIPFPPATPDGKPTPALITYTALRLVKPQLFVVDSGLMIKPKIPYVSINAPVGENIYERDAMSIESVEEAFDYAKIFGREVSKNSDCLMIAESIPAGTTTAGAVLKVLGKEPRVSSSMPENPVEIKMKVIEKAASRVNSEDPLEIIAKVGDPVMIGVLGVALGSEKPVVLAGGTQMAAIANLIKLFEEKFEVNIATTKYIAKDRTADIVGITPEDANVVAVDPLLKNSSKEGLRAYEEGFVKEGVGMGGATLLAYVKGYEDAFLREVEKDYEKIVG